MAETKDTNQKQLLALLRSKNQCLENWMRETQSFLTKAEPDAANMALAFIDDYEAARERGVRSLDLFDRKIHALLEQLTESERTSMPREDFKMEIKRNEILVAAIFKADDLVFGKIARIQKEISRKLVQSRQEAETLRKFRSTDGNRGGGIDQNA